jgi:hypothetical protein
MKLSEHGIHIDKQTGDLIVNVTDFGLFSGTYDSLWVNDSNYDDEYYYIIEAFENKDTYLPKEILELDELKDNDIEINLDKKNFFKDVAEIYCDYFANTFGGTWEYESYQSPKYYNYDTDHLYIKCTNPNYKLKTTLINYQNDILNEYIDTKNIEIYDIYHDYYGYECFQHNTIITIKGITI